MTVSTDISKNEYAGDGVTTSFPVTFRFLANGHIAAKLVDDATGSAIDLIETTDYTLAGAGDPSGGALVVIVPPALGETLVIIRDVPFTQEDDYVENDDFRAETLESGLDKLVMICQQLKEEVGRSVKVGVGTGSDPDALIASIQASEANSAASAESALSYATASSSSATTAAAASASASASALQAQAIADTIGDASTIDYNNTSSGLIATQVQAAIDELAAGGDKLLADPGYVELREGLILQFGTGVANGSGFTATNFPIAFPTAAIAAFAHLRQISTAVVFNTPASLTTTSVTFDHNLSGDVDIYWFALGY